MVGCTAYERLCYKGGEENQVTSNPDSLGSTSNLYWLALRAL
jgi:hypothetical protein